MTDDERNLLIAVAEAIRSWRPPSDIDEPLNKIKEYEEQKLRERLSFRRLEEEE